MAPKIHCFPPEVTLMSKHIQGEFTIVYTYELQSGISGTKYPPSPSHFSNSSSRKLWPNRSWLTRSSCSATSIGASGKVCVGWLTYHITWPGYTYASSISLARSAHVSLWGWEKENYGWLSSILDCWNDLTTRMFFQLKVLKDKFLSSFLVLHGFTDSVLSLTGWH